MVRKLSRYGRAEELEVPSFVPDLEIASHESEVYELGPLDQYLKL